MYWTQFCGGVHRSRLIISCLAESVPDNMAVPSAGLATIPAFVRIAATNVTAKDIFVLRNTERTSPSFLDARTFTSCCVCAATLFAAEEYTHDNAE